VADTVPLAVAAVSATAHGLLFLLFPLLVVLGGASDALSMTIPDRLSLALVGCFVALAPIAGLDAVAVALHGAAAAMVLAAAFALFACGWVGGGDAKFAAAIALWLGWSHVFAFAVAAAVFGGVVALTVLVLRYAARPAVASRCSPQLPWMHDSSRGMPFGAALAAAALLAYPKSIWIGLIGG
jgi:prepilin peptidase CpaA